jgi:hypothetical protein
MGTTMGPITAQIWVKLSHENGMVTRHNYIWFHVDWLKFQIHPRSFNVRHILMVDVKGLKVRHRGRLQWNDIPADFHENLTIGSKATSGRNTDGQTLKTRALWDTAACRLVGLLQRDFILAAVRT